MTRIKMPAHQSRGTESERGGSINRRWAFAAPISILLAFSFVETACAPGVERQIVIPIQGAQDFGLSKTELAQYNQTKEDFKEASKDKVFDLTTNNLSSTQAIISSDLTRATGVNISSDQVNIDFDQVDPFWINVGADRLSFAPVPVNIQVEGEETSRTLLFMFGKAEGGQWGQVGFFSPDQAPNESGEINANLVLDLTENANPEIGGLVIASDGNEHFSRQILFTKDKDGKLVLVESFPDPNKPSQAMVLNQNDLFSLTEAPNQPQANFTNVSFKMAAPAIATVTPAPPGGGESGTGSEEAPATVSVKSYETRDTSGKLISTEDIYGNVITATHEVAAPVADWAGVNERLGTEFAINLDGTIAGVEGLSINMTNGEAIFNFDGKGTEVYHIGNIKVQEIDGVKRLLVAGYAWNGETKSWEVFNPGFPMESPEAQLGWLMQVDVANGNWLRFHQRALEVLAEQGGFTSVDEYLKELFKNAMRPDQWYAQEVLIDKQDLNDDGTIDTLHNRKLVWTSGTFNSSLPVTRETIIKKEQYPWIGGLSYGFLADAGTAIISLDVLNGDESTTSLATILDDVLWTKFSNTSSFARAAMASGREWDESTAHPGAFIHSNDPEGWIFGLIINNLPDSTMTNSMGEKDVIITKDPTAAQRREETIVGDKITPAAELEIWGSVVLGNYHEE